MTTQFDLTDDQREIQDLAQKFTADAIAPHAAEWDEKHVFPRDTDEGSRRTRLRRDLRQSEAIGAASALAGSNPR